MASILVTGGAGFIGSHIATALVARGDRVRVLDNLCTGFRQNLAHVEADIEFVEGDVSDPEAAAAAVKNVEIVFHEAALASVPLSVERPLDSNRACVTGTVNILDQAHRAGVRRVVYAGSSAAYGDRSADALSTLTGSFNQPQNVQSLSVPEPSSSLLAALAASCLLIRRRR